MPASFVWQPGPTGGTPTNAANLNKLAVVADIGIAGTPTGDAGRAAFARRSQVAPRVRGVAVATGCYAGGDRTNTTATGTSRTVHTTGAAFTDIRLGYGNWISVLSSGTETPGASVLTVKASLRYGGVNYPATLNGALTATIQPGGFVHFDPIGIDLPAGTDFEVLTYLSASTATWESNSASYSSVLTGGFSTTDLTAPGAAAVADSIAYLYGPYRIDGTPLSATPVPSIVGIGDSIMVGDQENVNAIEGSAYGQSYGTAYRGPVGPFSGFLNRGLRGKAGVCILGRTGDRAAWWATQANRLYRMPLVAGATDVVCNLGRNDLNNGATLATLQASVLNIWTACSYRGARVHHTTLLPMTTSSDNWATAGAQTVTSSESIRVAFNGWLRAGAPIKNGAAVAVGTSGALIAGQVGHPLTDAIELADILESARDSGLWKTDGTAKRFTQDGTHPSAFGYRTLGDAFPAAALIAAA